MNVNKILWEKGDFTRIATTMRESGSALIDTLGVTKGMKVLDLGCGDGTTAMPAAKLGADVLGVDIASNLVAAGNARAAAEGLRNLKFQEGDASDLVGIESGSFDLVVSMFGAMFAPKPYDVAREMVRVTRPGGRIVMGNWIPEDPTLVAQVLKISSAYSPPPAAGFVSPMVWGREPDVIDRFGRAGIRAGDIVFARNIYGFHYLGTPSEFLNEFASFYGPSMGAIEAAEKIGKAADLRGELLGLFESQNTSDHTNVTEFSATFLRVIVCVH